MGDKDIRQAVEDAYAVAIMAERQRQTLGNLGARYMLPWWIVADTEAMMSGQVQRTHDQTAYPSRRRKP